MHSLCGPQAKAVKLITEKYIFNIFNIFSVLSLIGLKLGLCAVNMKALVQSWVLIKKLSNNLHFTTFLTTFSWTLQLKEFLRQLTISQIFGLRVKIFFKVD